MDQITHLTAFIDFDGDCISILWQEYRWVIAIVVAWRELLILWMNILGMKLGCEVDREAQYEQYADKAAAECVECRRASVGQLHRHCKHILWPDCRP